MEFLPPRELERRLAAARARRTRDLIALGRAPAAARAQAAEEFAVYDRFQMDDLGWLRLEGLDLPPSATESQRRSAHQGTTTRTPSRARAVRRDAIDDENTS